VTKGAIGDERFVQLGMSLETHRALRHIAVDRDCSLPKLLKSVINELVASYWSQQPVDNFSGLIPPETANGPEFQEDLMESQGAPGG
jgi:hypothetical protein